MEINLIFSKSLKKMSQYVVTISFYNIINKLQLMHLSFQNFSSSIDGKVLGSKTSPRGY